ncbi:hypothetical protein RXV86_04180 [Alisedimentitalea sp. MJ-SS2]|uniref:hypothetical protein n=1 Tax=Aliisedimentitalea sp. MJ-SS2 TaxID=3049795 RepID=UPI002912E643|nr:hypothetical protein [Alisedimentitalea sp. MJ-SS2]MDU8926577.1 hypothetical protein [Alisedimentitalea sp. MJ-SS2]
MSDFMRAFLGLHVGDEFEPGQTIYALCGAVPLPGWPEELPPEVLNPLINAADTSATAVLMVTDDYVMHVVDEAMTRLMKSFVFEYAPIPRAISDLWSGLIDDEDNIMRWPRSEIVEAGTYRYDYEASSFFGTKTIPLFYHVIRDSTGYYYLFLQQNLRGAEQKAEQMGTQLNLIAA